MTCCQLTHDDLTITRAAMCHLCPAGQRNAQGSVVACTVSERPIDGHLSGRRDCPLRRHPDPDGVVRWWGVRWIGVPWPLRWKLTASQARHLPGCGCVHRLRVWAESVCSGMRRRNPWNWTAVVLLVMLALVLTLYAM